MHKTLTEKLRDWRWWRDQGLHGLGGAFVSFLFWINASWMGGPGASVLPLLGLFAGSTAGNIREIIQNKDDDPADNDLVDSQIDAWAWTYGAATSSMLGIILYAS